MQQGKTEQCQVLAFGQLCLGGSLGGYILLSLRLVSRLRRSAQGALNDPSAKTSLTGALNGLLAIQWEKGLNFSMLLRNEKTGLTHYPTANTLSNG